MEINVDLLGLDMDPIAYFEVQPIRSQWGRDALQESDRRIRELAIAFLSEIQLKLNDDEGHRDIAVTTHRILLDRIADLDAIISAEPYRLRAAKAIERARDSAIALEAESCILDLLEARSYLYLGFGTSQHLSLLGLALQ